MAAQQIVDPDHRRAVDRLERQSRDVVITQSSVAGFLLHSNVRAADAEFAAGGSLMPPMKDPAPGPP